jgi:hypothetical protein
MVLRVHVHPCDRLVDDLEFEHSVAYGHRDDFDDEDDFYDVDAEEQDAEEDVPYHQMHDPDDDDDGHVAAASASSVLAHAGADADIVDDDLEDSHEWDDLHSGADSFAYDAALVNGLPQDLNARGSYRADGYVDSEDEEMNKILASGSDSD